MESEGIRILLLKVGQHSFGVEVSQIETLRKKETLFPPRDGGPADLQGFLSLGEKAVPALALGTRLGLSGNGSPRGLLIVTTQNPWPMAFRVDRIQGPILAHWKELRLLPKLLQELQARPIVWGVVWQKNRLVPLLDLDQVVPPEETAMLHEMGQVYQGGRDGGIEVA